MLRRIFGVLAATIFWTILVSVLWVLLLRVVPPPVTWVMARESGPLADVPRGAFQRSWVPMEKIASGMPLAVMASEDQRFPVHTGFEWKAMQKAMERNERSKGKKVRGGSTITQQTAKNVFCWPGRSFVRKAVEAWFTVLIELLWGKERIMEVYLNVAETGDHTYGVEGIARKCFGRSAAKLTDAQCALVAAVLPRPRSFNACKPSAYVGGRQRAIQRQMANIRPVVPAWGAPK